MNKKYSRMYSIDKGDKDFPATIQELIIRLLKQERKEKIQKIIKK